MTLCIAFCFRGGEDNAQYNRVIAAGLDVERIKVCVRARASVFAFVRARVHVSLECTCLSLQ